ncbi:MAG: serine hydrolase [Planctomycetales bacterium]
MVLKSLAIVFCISTLLDMPATAGEITLERVKAAAEKLEKKVRQEIQETGIPGIAVAVVFEDQVVLASGYGVRLAGKSEAVDASTVFQLASVSKPLGSTVIAALVGDGIVNWDAKISDLDPGFEMQQPWVTSQITIRDMYAHRSGLPSHAGDLLEDLGFPRDHILHQLRYQKPSTSFRTGYAYTNFGITEGAMAAAKAAGQSWEDLCQERLYQRLGMKSTSSRYADFIANENRAMGHVNENGKWAHKQQRQPDAQTPAGGVSSSVSDMAKWMQLQLAGGKFDGQQIIEEEALQQTHQPQIMIRFKTGNGLPSFYGLGWNVSWDHEGRLRLGHSGAFLMGAATCVALVPEEKLGVIVLTNAAPLGIPEALTSVFIDDVLYGKPTQDWLGIFKKIFAQMEAADKAELGDFSNPPSSPSPAEKKSAYLGSYQNDFFGKIHISEQNGNLVLAAGPDQQRQQFQLKHWDRDTFTFQPTGEFAVGTAGVTFTLGPDNLAQSVLLENLNVHGEGTFQKISDDQSGE